MFTFVATGTRVTRHVDVFIFFLQYFTILMIAPVCLFKDIVNDAFYTRHVTLDAMRDYNGRYTERSSYRSTFRAPRVEFAQWRAVIRDRSSISHREHSRGMKYYKQVTRKNMITIRDDRRRQKFTCRKMPIMSAINHVWRYLNLACTLVPPRTHRSPRLLCVLSQKNANDYKLQNYATENAL